MLVSGRARSFLYRSFYRAKASVRRGSRWPRAGRGESCNEGFEVEEFGEEVPERDEGEEEEATALTSAQIH